MEESIRNELLELKRILEIVGIDDDMSIEEAKRKIEEFKNSTKNKPTGFQRFLDWVAQPVVTGSTTVEEAKAAAILMKAYWEAIAIRDSTYKTEIHKHQHLHIHVNNEEKKVSEMSPDELAQLPPSTFMKLLKLEYKNKEEPK